MGEEEEGKYPFFFGTVYVKEGTRAIMYVQRIYFIKRKSLHG